MNKDDALKLFALLIGQSKDSKGEQPENKRPSDISKIIFEQLVDSEVMNVKLFFYSSGRSENNKPYTYTEKIGREDLVAILDAKKFLLDSKKTVGLLSKVRNESTVDAETSTEVVKNDNHSVADVDTESAEERASRLNDEEIARVWDAL